ncbi:MAG TPA: hypothetical protein VNA22_00420 [Pyrinomonadaceae bacterium]|nr:hypothetical protein [Pyrinomonadaceae bacterium]
MDKSNIDRSSERGAATVKFILVFFVLLLAGHAGWNYVPVAYNGASFKQEMDTAVVKGLGAAGRINPMQVVTASIQKASMDHNLPEDTYIEIKPVQGVIEAHVAYSQQVSMLPFGLYKYDYNFDYVARPQGYLMKQ